VIFRYAHTFIMTLIVITILIFLSPIFVPFVLFEFTKGIFDKWLKTILGYMIYPGLMFAFLALMMATIDSIYYGNLDTTSQAATGDQITDIAAACTDITSVYCVTMTAVGVTTSTDACDLYDSFSTTLVTQSTVDYIGDMNKISDDYADKILTPLLEIMLFAFLFYLFMDAISGFMSVLLGVQDIGAAAKGSFNVFNAIGSAGGAVASLAKKAGGKK
jgi:type IV secretion system protein VirB6